MEKQYFATILKCAICKKEGIVHISQGATIESKLQSESHKSGFRYGPLAHTDWCVACHECFEKSGIMLAQQRSERENFLGGE